MDFIDVNYNEDTEEVEGFEFRRGYGTDADSAESIGISYREIVVTVKAYLH